MATPEERAREVERHQNRKNAIEAAFRGTLEKVLAGEGFTASIIALILTCLEVIIILLAAPEPVISKITALVLGLGVGFLAVALIVYALIKSREVLIEAWMKHRTDENEEDTLHWANLTGS
jgi:hypothetical protein